MAKRKREVGHVDCRVTVIRSRRRTVALQISRPGEVVVRAPMTFPDREIRRLLEEKRGWIDTHMEQLARDMQEGKSLPQLSEEDIRSLTDRAVEVIPPRTAYWAEKAGVRYGRITIRCQRTRWGSCSSKGNLNFNCLLMLCPQEVIDYLIVHELCHRKEMNHSVRFRAEVEKLLPDYRKQEAWLREHGPALLARVNR